MCDTSQSAITSTIGVMVQPMFAVLFSHISGDFASLSSDAGACEGQADAMLLCYHPQSNYRDNGL